MKRNILAEFWQPIFSLDKTARVCLVRAAILFGELGRMRRNFPESILANEATGLFQIKSKGCLFRDALAAGGFNL